MNSATASSPQPPEPRASLMSARAWFAANGVSRQAEHRVLGGVSAALARRYDVDRFVMRLLMIATVIVFSPLVYAALWVLMPNEA